MEHQELYKNFSTLQERQLQRQREHLEKLKLKRNDNFFEHRKTIEKSPKQQRNKFNKCLSKILMLSEWMYVKPVDIEEYLLVACPKGIRMSFASSPDTQLKEATLYYKNGTQFKTVEANLPSNVILDCIYNEESKTIYLLDIISYTHVDLTDCDTTFRFYWMKTKYEEDDWRCLDDSNIKLLPHCACTNNEELIEFLSTAETVCDTSGLDGFLFFHKEVTYLSGPKTTPLVLWTFPFMINELFEEFRCLTLFDTLRPTKYTNYLEFIEKFNLKQNKKKYRGKNNESYNSEVMEVMNEIIEDEGQKMIELEMFGEDV